MLSACADKTPVPAQIPHLKLPVQLQVQRDVPGERQAWLLSVKKRHHGLIWSLTDSSGRSLAEQEQTNDGWKTSPKVDADFEAQELFSAVLFALTPEKELRFEYPGAQEMPNGRILGEHWTVSFFSDGVFRISLPGGINYLAMPAKGKPVH
jgi:hypothetical protein